MWQILYGPDELRQNFENTEALLLTLLEFARNPLNQQSFRMRAAGLALFLVKEDGFTEAGLVSMFSHLE